MERWRVFLNADRRLDLSRLEPARVWAVHNSAKRIDLPDGRTQLVTDDGLFSSAMSSLWMGRAQPEDEKRWEESVKALRSVAGRLAGFRGLPAGIDPMRADDVMAEYVRQLRPVLLLEDKPMRAAERIRFVPDKPEPLNIASSMRSFFALLFGSFLTGFADPVCPSCGIDLHPTPGGKISRAKRCRRCARKASWESIPITKRREKEAEKKRRQRAELKERLTKKGK